MFTESTLRLASPLLFILVLTSCNGSSTQEDPIEDEYFGTWHSECKENYDIGTSYIVEYIISSFVIEANLYSYSDSNCLVPNQSTPFVHIGDIEYYGYDIITTRDGYKARWYDSFIQPTDQDLEPSEYKMGFYLEGETLYEVYKSIDKINYGVSFSNFYTRK